MSSDAPAAKKLKTTGTPLYSDLDLSKLTFDSKPQGSNDINHASVKYDGTREAWVTTLTSPFPTIFLQPRQCARALGARSREYVFGLVLNPEGMLPTTHSAYTHFYTARGWDIVCGWN